MPFAPVPYRVSRTIRIEAPPERIFTELVDFRRWRDWSPWEGVDPEMNRSYTGPKSGVGSGYTWDGNKAAGAGSMSITGAERPRRVDIDLRFDKPFPADNDIRFDLDAEDGGAATMVTWTMSGEHTGLMRVLGRVMSMDKLVGKDFEKGLAQLKELIQPT
ncbi:SRPBCC family protein [Serinicoccus kebangsaanensis]|uniref:SRPBCC family protein n=1 Tax=Serinicoccus kebangsaanensis TaxID=2602069 RepID=UPI00124C9ACA|nr:SRPBCC family protein [Serinicoccus kebangsaanensis]